MMTRSTCHNKLPKSTSVALVVTLTALTFNACRPKTETTSTDTPEATRVEHIHKNSLTGETSSFKESQKSSPIHWQTWSKNLFTHAASERKTIFALIGSGTDSNSMEILERLNRSAASCALLNEHHVNVLIDSNIHPDLEFFAASLCMKSGTPVSTPLLIWFSYEGNPISWSPVGPNSSRDIDELISRMSNTVYRVWRDDPEYVLQNSRDDFARRMDSAIPSPVKEIDPLAPIRSVRQAASLFDPTSGTIDSMGRLSASRYIELLVAASHHPDTSDVQRARYAEVSTLAADNILLHGLIDPLDGGIFDGIQRSTSALPIFTKTLRAQALAMKSLYSLYRMSGDKKYLQAADAILAYTEKHLALPEGGYALGVTHANNSAIDNPCIWTIEEIEAALTDEEARICTLAFGLRGLGNIPLVDDRDRSYFRKNTLTWKLSLSELATQTSLDEATLKQRLESITKKLAKLRTERPRKQSRENLCTADATALMAISSVTAYRATGKPEHLDRATKLLTFIRENFIGETGGLHRARYNGKLQSYPATGVDHALVCQAALDLHEVTFDPTWLKFASDIHQRMNLMLAAPNTYYITEYDGTDYPKTYKIQQFYTFRNLDNDSTWAISYSNTKRLALQEAGDKLKAQYDSLAGILFRTATLEPISSIDFLTADAKLLRKTVYIKMPATPALLEHAIRKPCQIVPVTDQGNYPELGDQATKLPVGTATVILRGKVIGTATTPEELDTLIK